MWKLVVSAWADKFKDKAAAAAKAVLVSVEKRMENSWLKSSKKEKRKKEKK